MKIPMDSSDSTFQRGGELTTITRREIEPAMNRLNNRPEKCLGIKTPNEVFSGIKLQIALAS